MVMFENTLAIVVMVLNFTIPDVSSSLKYRIRREEYITKEIIIRTERLKAAGRLRSGQSDSNPELRLRKREERSGPGDQQRIV